MIYLFIYFYLLFLVYSFDYKNKNRNKNFHYNTAFTILVLLSALRYRMAPDTVAYERMFNSDAVPLSGLTFELLMNGKYQPLWILINSIAKSLGNYIYLQFITAIILNLTIFHFFKKCSTKWFTCILFYYLVDYFYFNMEIVRESLAVGFFLIAIISFNNTKIWKTYFYITIAFMFHFYAIILYSIPFFLSKKISSKLKLIFLILLFIIVYNAENVILTVAGYLVNIIAVDITFYDLVQFDISYLGYLFYFLKILPILVIFILYKKKELPNVTIEKHILYNLSYVYIFIILIRITTIPHIERLSNYFVMFIIVMLTGAIYDYSKNKFLITFKFKSILTITTVVFCFQVAQYLQKDPIFDISLYKRYYPYYSVFSKETEPDREILIKLEAKE